MNRRTFLAAAGGAGSAGAAGCLGFGGEPDSDSTETATHGLGEVLVWSALDEGETADANVTVEKDGSRVYDETHSFEGETRLSIVEEWMGDAVPYTVTFDSAVIDTPTVYSTAEADESFRNRHGCWRVHLEFGASSKVDRYVSSVRCPGEPTEESESSDAR